MPPSHVAFLSLGSDRLVLSPATVHVTVQSCAGGLVPRLETLDEFQSITTGYGRSSSLKYQTYYDLLINGCVRYDRTKKANIAKRGHIYQTSSAPDNDGFNDEIPYETPGRDPYMGIDTPSDEFYNIHTTQYVPPMSARHKLHPRLPKPNQSPETFPKKQAKDGLVLLICQHIYTNS